MEDSGHYKKINVGQNFLQYNKSSKKQSLNKKKTEYISQLKPLTVKELLLEKLKKYKQEKSRKKRNLESKLQPNLSSYQTQDASIPSLTATFSQKSNQLKKTKVQKPKINRDFAQREIERQTIQPEYGNLKNGIKPTYRQFLKNKTIRKDNPKTHVKVEIEKKINLGRNYTQKKVGVFIKSNNTRRQMNDEKVDLQRSNMKTVKNYLKSQNLIKYGSEAPNELLREIYSSSKLCGDIFNINGQSLVHNYMNDKQ